MIRNEQFKRTCSAHFLACIFSLSFMVFFFSPLSFVHAQLIPSPLIPCDGSAASPCTFDSFIKLIQNVITALIVLAIPATAIVLGYAGFLMVTSGGSEEKVHHAKDIFTHVAIGFIFILSAWLIVYTITTALLKEDTAKDYNLLK